MVTTSYPSKVMIDDDRKLDEVVSLPPDSSKSKNKESHTVMATAETEQMKNKKVNSKPKDEEIIQPLNRNRSTDFASRFMYTFRKAYPASTSGSTPQMDEKPVADTSTDADAKVSIISLQDSSQVENEVETGSKKEVAAASLLTDGDDAGNKKEVPVVSGKQDSVLPPPIAMDKSPGISMSIGPDSPMNLDHDGEVVTVASQTMEIPLAEDGDLSGSVLSFQVDDAVSTMSEELLRTMEEETAPKIVDTRPVDDNQVPVTSRTEVNESNVSPEDVRAMAGELGLDSFMTVGENLMRRSSVGEDLPEEAQPVGKQDKVVRVACGFVLALVLLGMTFIVYRMPHNQIFIASDLKMNSLFSPVSKIYTKIRREYTPENVTEQIPVLVKEDKNFLEKGLFGSGAAPLEAIDHVEEEQFFISSLLNTSSWADTPAPPDPSPITAAKQGRLMHSSSPPNPSPITAAKQGRIMHSSFISAKIPEWTQNLEIGASVYSLVNFRSAEQSTSEFWSAVYSVLSLSTFCPGLLTWALLSVAIGLTTWVIFLKRKGKSTDDGDMKIPKKAKGKTIREAKKDELRKEAEENLYVTIDLSKYKKLRKDTLKAILMERSCRISGVKGELIHRLLEDYHKELDGLAYRILQRRLKKQGLNAAGKRKELITRLLEAGPEKN